jgi:ATP-dependent DNA helicase RecG
MPFFCYNNHMFELNTPIENLYLVGPARAKLLKRLEIKTLEDLIFYFPRAHHDLSQFVSIADLKAGMTSNIKAKILEVKSFRTKVRKLSLTQALIEDDTGSIICIWFNQPFLSKILIKNQQFIFSGKVAISKNKLQMQNPVYEQERAEQIHTSRLVPLYSLTASLTQKQIRFIIKTYLDKIELPEYLPKEIIDAENLLDENSAVRAFHFPKDQAQLAMAQNRLAFDEIFQTQFRVLQYKKTREQKNSIKINPNIDLAPKIQELPFTLTDGQKQALKEILSDFQKPYPANRLLEGDVGSGKTIIAALAMYLLAKNNLQAVLLSPTEVLAQQHYANFLKLFLNDGFDICLLTSSQSRLNGNPVSKDTLLAAIKTNRAKIILGTHALLEKNVKFSKLALVVIDEQHRFGVQQRSVLKQISNAHLLTMSATPIPRTLALTLYGDLDLSRLTELPAGRQKILTKIVSEENRTKAYEFIAKQILSGRQIFVICPLIEESDKLGVKSATQEYKKLAQQIFPQFKVGLLHGKLKPAEKELIMQKFKDNELNILVSTSVIEVGVDVPNATVMMIEGSERFGLAQLHQFRGRVGRSEHKSYCFLFSDDPASIQNPRLQALTESNNGFELAEKDLAIRGSGDLYGTVQSGYDFKIANLSNLDLVERSRAYAEKLLNNNVELNIRRQSIVHLE